ncbi:TMEM165/GDT1 family protein [Sphingomonas profundi]|uniref:TMEM165/GDT1 family protein n=1 Tax=Alterirhizorhabdus profundi TaxID=2681549 RepID=UPI0012E82285|nr:TMEM165/GDT1 family protein [Sphingomonas profundi]
MDALLPAFVAAGLAEIGDRTQLLAILLAAHYRAPLAVIGGVAVAALANSLLAAFGGTMIHDLINHRAIALMLAVGLVFAGAGAFWRPRPPLLSTYGPIGAFGTTAIGFFILEFGDKTQLLTMTIAARVDSLLLAGVGAAAGITLANVPAVLLAQEWPRLVPLPAVRAGIGILFLVIGAVVAIGALRIG